MRVEEFHTLKKEPEKYLFNKAMNLKHDLEQVNPPDFHFFISTMGKNEPGSFKAVFQNFPGSDIS